MWVPAYLQVFDLMRKQEQTRLAELAAEKSHHEAIQAHKDIVGYPRSYNFRASDVLFVFF